MTNLFISPKSKSESKNIAIVELLKYLNQIPSWGNRNFLKTISLAEPIDIRPLRFEEIYTASQLIAMRLAKQVSDDELYHNNVFTIGIQKGTNFLDTDTEAKLY